MTQTEKPLTPLELFQRGIAMTREIRGRIEESRAYYLGRSSHAPGQPLSEVFDPMRGPNEHKRILEAIEKVNRNQLLSHKIERQLLKMHDDHDDAADGSADDARHSTPVRAAMVQLTALKIYNSRASNANAIKCSFFKAFRPIPGAYDKYNSFCRSVDRMLRTFLS